MKREFVTYEIALKLKELGFNKRCFGHYYDNMKVLFNCGEPKFSDVFATIKNKDNKDKTIIACPLWQQVIDWLREKHKLHVVFEFDKLKDKDDLEDIETYTYRINEQWHEGLDWSDYKYGFKHICSIHNLPSFKKARKQAILKALELIENK